MSQATLAPMMFNPAPRRDGGFLSLVTRFMLFVTLAVCVIVPHSFQTPTAALVALTTLFAVLGLQQSAWFDRVILLYCLGTTVTVFYLFLGYMSGAPNDAMVQISLVYIVSPLMWIVIGATFEQRLGAEKLVRWLTLFTWASMLSIVLFFYAFLTFGKESVKFLTESANVNVAGGFAGATMLVYGSFIFLAGAFFAQPAVIRWRVARFLMPAGLVIAALTSGRSAFIIAIPIGYVVGYMLRPGLSPAARAVAGPGLAILPTIGALTASVLGLVALNAMFAQIDLTLIVNLFWDKLLSGGGVERVEQAVALWEGVEQSYGLGNGLGVGVHYLRSEEFPWRYELIPLASLLRVGIVGTIVYVLPFFLYAGMLVRRFSQRKLTLADTYLAGGLAAAGAGAFTNPYIESFIFQWMFFMPVVMLGIANERESKAEALPSPPASSPEAAPPQPLEQG